MKKSLDGLTPEFMTLFFIFISLTCLNDIAFCISQMFVALSTYFHEKLFDLQTNPPPPPLKKGNAMKLV
jgi:hypothetical protein